MGRNKIMPFLSLFKNGFYSESWLFKNMQKALLESESVSDLKLLLDLAKKLGIKSKILSMDEIEEIGMANAIKIGRTNEYIDTNEFLKKISSWLSLLIKDLKKIQIK